MKQRKIIPLIVIIISGIIIAFAAAILFLHQDQEQGETLSAVFPSLEEQLADAIRIRISEEEQVLSEVTEEEVPPVPPEQLELQLVPQSPYVEGEIWLDENWRFAENSVIHSGAAVLYRAGANRNGIVIGVNAGHGTEGGSSAQTPCHPDYTPKVTGGSTAAGSIYATCVSGGMTFHDGTAEREVTLREAEIFRDKLLEAGFDVLMVRDGSDVQLDNVARTVICNNTADCHIAIHWDGDGLDYDKGCYFMSVPEGIKYLDNVAAVWQQSEALGTSLIGGLGNAGRLIWGSGSMVSDLTQTSYSSIPSVDIELGNQSSSHTEEDLEQIAEGLLLGVKIYYGM